MSDGIRTCRDTGPALCDARLITECLMGVALVGESGYKKMAVVRVVRLSCLTFFDGVDDAGIGDTMVTSLCD